MSDSTTAKKCPCCKSLRAMREAAKHPSITSITAAKQANQAFGGEVEDLCKTAAAIPLREDPRRRWHPISGEMNMTESAPTHHHPEPSRDIRRICQTCGEHTYCVIVRRIVKGKHTMIREAQALCPRCAEARP